MKTKLHYLLIILFAYSLHAQDDISVEKHQFKVDFLFDPGISYEYGLTTRSTLTTKVGLAFGYKSDDYYGSRVLFGPLISEQFRYYTFKSRMKKAKKTSQNSGDYFGLGTSYVGLPLGHRNENIVDAFHITGVGGMQRTYKSGFNLALEAGIDYLIADDANNKGINPYLNFTLGWVLANKKNAVK